MANRSKEVMGMLKGLAEKEVDSATEALAVAMKSADEAQSKYDMLVEYHKDYKQSFEQQLKKGIGIQAHSNFQGFFRKLEMAVLGQLELLQKAKQHVALQKKLWKESQRKKISYEVLEQRHDSKQLKQELKRDQQAMDEFAMRKGRNSR
jgi:flagellar protein FliJ